MRRLLAILAGIAVFFALGVIWIDRDERGDKLVTNPDGSVSATNASPTWSFGFGKKQQEPSAVRTFDGFGQEVATPKQVAISEGVSVIDEASVLSASEKAALVQRGAAVSRSIERKLAVVLIRPSEGDSLEQVTWAISAAANSEVRPLLLVVDVDTGAVRVDGASGPHAAAAIAGAVRDEVKAGRYAAGVSRGLDRIAQEGREI